MTLWTLIIRNFRYHARAHLGTLLGVAISSAVLIGALVVGNSIRGSLRSMALARVGKVDYALSSGDRFFRAKLASEMSPAFTHPPAAVLQLPGMALNQESTARANRIQVIGVDERFWDFANVQPSQVTIPPDSVVLNQRLANHLRLKLGDTVLLRMHKPSLLSREMPISPQEDFSVALRVTVQAVVSDEELGRFSLEANQIPPLNAFVSRKFLQEKLGLGDKANLLLSSSSCNAATTPGAVLRDYFKLTDAELTFVETNEVRELRSVRIFMESAVVRAADEVSTNNTKILTYFVNELRVGDKTAPYSMVTAATAPLIPPGLRDDEILVNQWLADDLRARPGDTLQVRYFVMGADQRLVEQTNSFRVRTTVLLKGQYADRGLMPEFPGIAKAEKTENWDAGFPIEMSRIRPKDEEYWKEYRGTPKAFVTLTAGQAMWANRFGDVTAIRWREPVSPQEVQRTFSAALNPAALGFSFQPIREQALAASTPSQDYGQLFLGFSFFLITAALILVGLLFQLGVEKRAVETGTLLSLGFQPKQVRRILLLEGTLLSAIGTLLGVYGGILYAKAMLRALTTIWHSAVGTTALMLHLNPATILIGAVASIMVSVVTIWLVTRKQAKRPARELLAEGDIETLPAPGRSWAGILACSCGAGALVLIGWAAKKNDAATSGIFFGAGALMLIAGLASTAFLFRKLAKAIPARLTFNSLTLRNASRRRKRSLATVALLASGTFLVVAVGAFRLETQREGMKRDSGTGGFAFIGETALPVTKNLNESSAREFFAFDEKQFTDVRFVPFRVRGGDDASCLNLNRAQKPRLLGVQPDELSRRKAFTFAKVQRGLSADNPWLLLKAESPDGAIPAIGDAASIQWALRKKVGETIDYADERGQRFKIRIVAAVANSILQGSLVIDESQFVQRFPGETGHRMFLIDAPSNQANEVSQKLSRSLRDVGLELTPTAERLAAFNAVQNTYLSTFQVLGGLGLLLGSAGLAVIVLRNVLERRGELALLLALGFRQRSLRWLVLGEHAALLAMGLFIGLVCALAAILPALISPGAERPHWSVFITLAAILLSGLLWTFAASMFALRGRLLNALRSE